MDKAADIVRHFCIYENKDKYCAWPAIARTAEGDIVVLYTRTEEHISPEGQIVLSRSRDNARTWEEPTVIFDTPIDDRESGVTTLRDGRLLGHFWSHQWNAQTYRNLPEDAYFPGVIDPWIERVNSLDYLKAGHLHGAWNAVSDDGGHTWSEPVRGKDSIHGGVQLQDGRILVAAYRQDGMNIGIHRQNEPLTPWTRIANVVTPHPETVRFGEPHLTQLNNGRVIMLIRATAIPYDDKSPRSYLWATYSDDLGKTWTAPYQTPLWGFPPHLTQLSDGRVVATYGVRRPPYGQRVCISHDGVTWLGENELVIRDDGPNGDLGYPVSMEMEPGRVLTVYYQANVPPGTRQQNRPPHPDRVKAGILGTVWNVPPPRPHPRAIHIGERRELFVDRMMVDRLDNISHRLHHPRHEGVALRFDKPWEGGFSGYATVILDGALYRMYYRGNHSSGDKSSPVTCYAESEDGIRWAKPELGLFEANGTKKNNIILGDQSPHSHNFSPFLDKRPDVPPEERYKAISGVEKSGLYIFVSKDGIHWKLIRDEPVFTQGMFDSHNVAFWSESEQQYICYFRTWTGEGYSGFRTISRTTSKDFIHWTDGAEVSFGDTPMEHLYTSGAHPYFRAPHITVAAAKRFFPDKPAFDPGKIERTFPVTPGYAKFSSDSIFMSSRGGYEFDRTFMEAFIRPGDTTEDWISRDNTPALGVVPGNEREMFLYRLSHYAQPSAHLSRYALRTDGFASLEAPYQGGEFLTRPFTFSGNRLALNCATSAAGEIRVEIQRADGTPLPEYSMEKSHRIFGDPICRTVSWESGSDLSPIRGDVVRLRIHMRDANLYSFRFCKAPSCQTG